MYNYDFSTTLGVDADIEPYGQLDFSDGDVLLLAQASPIIQGRPHYLIFRVHKFMLRHHSTIFDNMFEDATSDADTHDGIPLIHMPGDEAEDLARILTYLYNPSKLTFRRLDPDTPLSISGAVRLTRKYIMDALHARLVRQVTDDWPRTLHEWDQYEAEATAISAAIASDGPSVRPPGYRRLADCVPEPAAAIMFATEFGCTDVLPAAFYQLARIRADEDWSLLGRAKEGCAARAPPDAKAQAKADGASGGPRLARLARWGELDCETLLRYMRGCARLDDFRERMLAADVIACAISPGCRPWWSCPEVPRPRERGEGGAAPCFDFVTALFEWAWLRRRTRDPLKALKDCLEWRTAPARVYEVCPDGLCNRCTVVLQDWVTEMRQFLWRSLPDYFEL